jgi:DNA-binding NarL/FixJ family response regulator
MMTLSRGSEPKMDPANEPQLSTAYRVVIVDDHPLFRAALKSAVCAACATGEFFEADSVAALFDLLERQPNVDLLLLDLNLPGAHGFSALAYLRGAYPELPVVVVSALDDPTTVQQAMAFGAQGFISKSAHADSISASVRAVLRGDIVTPAGYRAGGAGLPDRAALEVAERLAQLTPQQFRVFSKLCSGRLNKQIAYELQITEATVKAHMTAIMRKLGAANRTQTALLAARLTLNPDEIKVQPEEPD